MVALSHLPFLAASEAAGRLGVEGRHSLDLCCVICRFRNTFY